MHITISGRGVDLTDAIESYVTKKINTLEKFFDSILRANVVLGKVSNHHNKGDVFFAECKVEVPGNDIFCREDAASVYEAVDLLRDRLEAELKKHKVKLRNNIKVQKRSTRATKEYSPTDL